MRISYEHLKLITGSWLRPDRGDKAPGMTDQLQLCSAYGKPSQPITSSLAAQPALPGALLEAGTTQVEEKTSKQLWKGPGPVTNPCALRHAAQGTSVAPQIQLLVQPCPAEGLQSLPEPSSLAGICSALIQLQHVRCCVGRETDSAQGKPTYRVG